MKPTTWIPLAAILFAASACNNGVGGTTEGSGGSGAGTASGGGGGSVDPPGEQVITIEMESFTVPPGSEVYKCQNFANPFGGVETNIRKFESHMIEGSHHMLLFYKENAVDTGVKDCSGLEFTATPYSTQLPDDSVTFPDGVAALMKGTTGIRLQSHYLNTTDKEITAHVQVKLHVAKPETITQHAGVLFVVEPKIDVAPASTATIQHDCALPMDMNIIKAGSHMHKHGTHFGSTIAGNSIFETTTWDDPKPAFFDPARSVNGGAPLHFECTFKNDGATTLHFGESASSDEMCIFVASFYPLPEGSPATVTCF